MLAQFLLSLVELHQWPMKREIRNAFLIITKSRKFKKDVLSERCSPLEDRKSATFFKITDDISKLDCPPIIKNSTLISANDLECEVSKLKDKWDGEFDTLSIFYEENIRALTINYVNLNNIIINLVIKARENIIEIEK